MADGGGRGGGRGWYYKQKYGGGGRGGGGGGGGEGRGGGGRGGYGGGRGGGGRGGGGYGGGGGGYGGYAPQAAEDSYGGGHGAGGGSSQDLKATLHRIDGKGYKAYKDIEGQWSFPGFTLIVDHAQSDPFANPSRCRVRVAAGFAQFPAETFSTPTRRVALCDYLTRAFSYHVRGAGADQRTEAGGWSGAKGGELTIDAPGQHVLERTSVLVTAEAVEARFTVALPAQGRSVMGTWAAQVLVEQLPGFVRSALLYASLDPRRLAQHIHTVEDAEELRKMLAPAGLVAFVADGAVLPRKSGASDEPMAEGVVPFRAPPTLAREFVLPNRGAVRGMAVPRGVTIIVGGGFHGKSTLLQAIEMGVYNHVPGDGRELVVSDPNAVKIRAEDGRAVEGVDISPFISNLPFDKDTKSFCTPDASGSTSQAANIQEALELGCSTLVIDEDTAATNFMIRDARMQALVAPEKEPITPFISKVRALYQQHGVSSLLVIGGSGDYFDVADTVVMMEAFAPRDVTAEARGIAARFATPEGARYLAQAAAAPFGSVKQRRPTVIYPGADFKVATRTKAVISFGEEEINIAAVEQVAEKSQTRAIADAIQLFRRWVGPSGGTKSVAQLVRELEALWDQQGLDALNPPMHFGHYARPRRFELAAALNRLRSLKVT